LGGGSNYSPLPYKSGHSFPVPVFVCRRGNGRNLKRASGKMDAQLARIGDALGCLLQSNISGAIIREYDLPFYDQGGCAVLAGALVPYLRERGYTTAASYGVVRVVDGIPSAGPGHYFVGLPPEGPFLDSNGWHDGRALIEDNRRDLLAQMEPHWDSSLSPQENHRLRQRARQDAGRRINVVIVRAAPHIGCTLSDIECPRGAVARLRTFLEQHLPYPFVVVRDENTTLYSLWTWPDGQHLFVDGIPLDRIQGTPYDNEYLEDIVALVRDAINADPSVQACVDYE